LKDEKQRIFDRNNLMKR